MFVNEAIAQRPMSLYIESTTPEWRLDTGVKAIIYHSCRRQRYTPLTPLFSADSVTNNDVVLIVSDYNWYAVFEVYEFVDAAAVGVWDSAFISLPTFTLLSLPLCLECYNRP